MRERSSLSVLVRFIQTAFRLPARRSAVRLAVRAASATHRRSVPSMTRSRRSYADYSGHAGDDQRPESKIQVWRGRYASEAKQHNALLPCGRHSQHTEAEEKKKKKSGNNLRCEGDRTGPGRFVTLAKNWWAAKSSTLVSHGGQPGLVTGGANGIPPSAISLAKMACFHGK